MTMANNGDSNVLVDNDLANDDMFPQIVNSCYYETDEFNDLFKSHIYNNKMKILNINARSIIKNYNEFAVILQNFEISFDIITMEETWLDDSLTPLVQMDGYSLITKHKKRRKEGGGIGIYVRNDLKYIERSDLDCPEGYEDFFSYKFIEIVNEIPSKNIILGVLYRPPGGNTVQDFTEHLNMLLPKLNKENKNLVLMGDTNINILKCSEHKPSADYLDTLLSYGLIPKITVPTRVTHSSATLIDHIFTNDKSSGQSLAGTIKSSMTDHYFNFILLESSTKLEYPKTITYRPFTASNVSRFEDALNNYDYTDIMSMENVDDAYDGLILAYDSVLDKTIPEKTVKFNKYKHNLKPWITKELRLSIKQRDKLHQKLKRCKNKIKRDTLEKEYIDYRSNLHKQIKSAKRYYERQIFEKHKNDIKLIWDNINRLIGKNVNKTSVPDKILCENGNTLSNLKDIADGFNDYYVNVGPNLSKKINSEKMEKSNMPFITNPKSFFLYPTHAEEVINVITLLKPKTSTGHDKISPKLIKQLYDRKHNEPIRARGVIPPLVHIINLSLSTGVIPKAMKLAKVVPIFKNKGASTDTSNYRPVSLLPVLSKVLERIVYNRLFQFIVKNKILNKSQYGFQKDLSTELAILELQDRINNSLNKNECCVGIFMDLSKAFDTLDHKILLYKLNHYGIRGIALSWFQNYLSDRNQFVCVNGTNSGHLPIKCGVPQGSILGPLLFLVYVNDLASVSKHAATILFADDTNVIYTGKNYEDICMLVQTDLKIISDWFRCNKLALNETKTNYVIFHLSHKKPPENFSITLNGIELNRVKNTKFLGVIISENLKWNDHINYVSSKVSRATGILARLKYCLPKCILLMIYNSLCLSHLAYAITVWGSSPPSTIDRLVKLHKKGIRHVCNSKYNAHTEPLYKEMKILNLPDLFKLNCNKLMYRKNNGTLHSYHSEQLKTKSERRITIKDTRQKYDVDLFTHKAISKINSINSKVASAWNTLPFEIKTCNFENVRFFNQFMKKHYISYYNLNCQKMNCYICNK